MNTLPTFPEKFVNEFWEPTRRQLEPQGASREQILKAANKTASTTLGFEVEVSRRSLYNYLREV